jgi:hypothetical protein
MNEIDVNDSDIERPIAKGKTWLHYIIMLGLIWQGDV